MKYNDEAFALLEDNTIECLYYLDNSGKIDMSSRRYFYKEGSNWYLDHDVFKNGCIYRLHHKIVKFLSSDELEKMK